MSSRPMRDAASPRLPRRRLGAADARELILTAAEALLIRSGPEGLRLTEIAIEAGVTHPNVLYHFGSIAELERQLAQRVAVNLAEDVARVFVGDDGMTTSAARLAVPAERAVAAVFQVFDTRGYARLLAWLVLSNNEPDFAALQTNLEFLRAAIAAHPALGGEGGDAFRSRIEGAIKLVIVAAIGYGLTRHIVDGFFPEAAAQPGVAQLLGELLSAPG